MARQNGGDSAAGLTLHSNFARRYAALKREHPIGHAEASAMKLQHALGLQDSHWGAVETHLDERGIY